MDPSQKDRTSGRVAPGPQSGATPSPAPVAARPAGATTAFEGELSFFSLPELVQMVCSSGQDAEISITGRVELRDDEPEQRGRVIVRGGRVFRCSAETTSGEAAFFELARLRHGRFSVNPLPSEGKDQASLLRYSWQELLLESARREDEAKRDSGVMPEPSPPTQRAAGADGYVELFGSTPPPPAGPTARGDIYDRATERGQLIPFPRKAHTEPTPTLPATPLRARSATPPPPSATPLPASVTRPPPTARPVPLAASSRSPEAPARGSARSSGSPLERLIQEATGAYLRREFDRALELFERCRELDPSDRRVEHNIERLKNRRNRP